MSTAGVTFFDKEAVLRALDDYDRALAAREPEVEEVIVLPHRGGRLPVHAGGAGPDVGRGEPLHPGRPPLGAYGLPAMPMKNPPHPGGLIRRQVFGPLGLSVTEGAAALGVTRQALSLLLNERTALSPEMALRIEKAFGPTMDHLMRMQRACNRARRRR